MNLIIPMAGKGTRLRPHTLVTPKPLIEIAGKKIIQRIVDLVVKESQIKINQLGFIIESPDSKIERMLNEIAKKNKITHHIFYQGHPQGTAHAIYCAKSILKGETIIIFSDTLCETKLNFPKEVEGCIFVKEVKDPSAYGVVKTNELGQVVEFIEKPSSPVSNLAIVGLYYFKDGGKLKKALKSILDNNIVEKGEYQLTTALEHLKNKNIKFITRKIKSWLDFGTPKNVLLSLSEILKSEKQECGNFPKTVINMPCYIAEGVSIENSVIGPNVSIGAGTVIKSSKIKNSIIQSNCKINGVSFQNSIIGHFVEYNNLAKELNIGDYSTFK